MFFFIFIVDLGSDQGQKRIVNDFFENSSRAEIAYELINEEDHLHTSMQHSLDHKPLVIVAEFDDHAQCHAKKCRQDCLTGF